MKGKKRFESLGNISFTVEVDDDRVKLTQHHYGGEPVTFDLYEKGAFLEAVEWIKKYWELGV